MNWLKMLGLKDRSDTYRDDRSSKDEFFTATSQEDGKPLVFRGRLRVPTGVSKADLPTLVTITWPYEPKNETGMPDQDTNAAQVLFDDLIEVLDSSKTALLMLVRTGDGKKEWHWYVSNYDQWIDGLNEVLTNSPDFPIEIGYCSDPEWLFYEKFISSMQI